MKRMLAWAVALLAATSSTVSAVSAGIPFNTLVYKGTHNSYGCECGGIFSCENSPPWMNHPLQKQIDVFGAWSVELDFGYVLSASYEWRGQIGHDEPLSTTGACAAWGNGTRYLSDYLQVVESTRSLAYRPIFLMLERKAGDAWDTCVSCDPFAIAESELRRVFAVTQIFGPKAFREYHPANRDGVVGNEVFPSVPELAGRVVPMLEGVGIPADRSGTDLVWGPGDRPLRASVSDECTSAAWVDARIAEGTNVLKLDQYQGDWTFEYGVPPNPIVVDHSAAPATTVTDVEGDTWCASLGCACPNGDVSVGQVVHPQGTWGFASGSGFPFGTIASAVHRARGIVPGKGASPLRAGYGWTIVVRPGSYAETVTIDIPLTLQVDDRFPGTVLIGSP